MQGPAFSLLVRRSWMLGPAEPLFDVGSTPSDPRSSRFRGSGVSGLRLRQACVGRVTPDPRCVTRTRIRVRRYAGRPGIARPTCTWVLSVTTCASVSLCGRGSVVIEPTMSFTLGRSGMYRSDPRRRRGSSFIPDPRACQAYVGPGRRT